jgi:hypothetical protein
MFKRWHEDLLTFFVLFIFYLSLGAFLCIERCYLPYDSLARLVSAWLVLHGTEIKLASIGFVWPPLPTLAIIPFTVVPYLVDHWLAAVIPSAALMAAAGVTIGKIASLVQIPNWWRRVLVLLFALNPLIIIFGINGMSEAMLVAVFLAGSYWLIRFYKSDRHTDMILAALFFSLLPLIRYEFVLITAWSGVVLLLHSWRRRTSFTTQKFQNYLEGRILAYSSLAIYPVFLWSVFNWFIMGSPLYFLVNDRSAVSLADLQISSYTSLLTNPISAAELVYGVWFLSFLLGLIGLILIIYLGFRQDKYALIGIGLFFFVVPTLQFILLTQRANVPLLRYFMMAVPIGIVVALTAWDDFADWARRKRKNHWLAYGGLCLLFLGSNIGTLQQVYTYPYQNIEQETWRALTTQEKIENTNFDEAFQIGQELTRIIPPGSRVLIDTYQFGFGILLGAGNHDLFMDFTDPNYEQAILDPAAYVDYVIVPRVEGRGAFYAINRAYKKLHSQGATWADLVDVLPSTNLQWKLYKVKH